MEEVWSLEFGVWSWGKKCRVWSLEEVWNVEFGVWSWEEVWKKFGVGNWGEDWG